MSENNSKLSVENGGPGSPRPRFSLRSKLVLMAASLAVLPLTAVGLFLVDINAETVAVLSRDLQLAVLDDVSRMVNDEFVEAQDGLHAVGRVLADPEISGEVAVAVALAIVEANESLDHASVYDRHGALIDTIREERLSDLEPATTLSPALRQAAVASNVGTGDVELRAGEARVLLAVPLRARGEVTGFASSLVSLTDVQRRVERIAEGRFQDLPNSLFIVDENLRFVAHENPEQLRALASAGQEGGLQGVDPNTLSADVARSAEYTTADGERLVGSMVRVPGRPWIVVAQIPTSVAYESLGRMRTIVVATVAVAIVLALVVGLLMSRKLTAPLSSLTAFAGRLARSEFGQSVTVQTNDELALLAQAMSRAAEDLAASQKRLAEEAAIRSDLGRYLPAELVDQVIRREHDMSLGGTKKEITVLFADVVAFTPLTEKLEPGTVVTILNELFTIMTEIVFRNGGTVDKFIGDCIMAMWGAPTPLEDHAERAITAAEEMLTWLETGNTTWKQRFGVTIQLAIGIHTGIAVVGNIGSETRMEYTAIGDVVNVAARLETIARPQQILVSAETRAAAGDMFDYLDLNERRLSGREATVTLFEVRS